MIDINKQVKDLREAGEHSNDELGEWWVALTDLYPIILDCGSNVFLEAYEKEVSNEHLRFKEDFEFVEKTVSRNVTYKELRMKGEE